MKKRPVKKEMTIDQLAIIVGKGFENTATKDDLKELATKDELHNLDSRLTKIEGKLGDIDHRLGRIENNHDRRIESPEDKMRIITTTLEKNLKIKLPSSL